MEEPDPTDLTHEQGRPVKLPKPTDPLVPLPIIQKKVVEERECEFIFF